MTILIHRFPALHAKTSLSRTEVWRKEKAGEFPARIQLGRQSVGWDAAEVDRWLKSCKRGVLAQPSGIVKLKRKVSRQRGALVRRVKARG